MLIKLAIQHATALTKLTDDRLRQIDSKMLVGAVLLDFIAAFHGP